MSHTSTGSRAYSVPLAQIVPPLARKLKVPISCFFRLPWVMVAPSKGQFVAIPSEGYSWFHGFHKCCFLLVEVMNGGGVIEASNTESADSGS
ncbi:hypothetical protein QOT17_014953 [Balamuthia mandrillaris]